MLMRLASQPQVGDSTFSSGADISRFQRRSVPGKAAAGEGLAGMGPSGAPAPGAPQGGIYPGAATATGPVVRIARGNAVTAVPVGGK